MLIFTLRPCVPRSPARPPKMLKITPQSASRWPDKPHLRPSWRHLCSILAPSWAILPPAWASSACPKSAKSGQDSLLATFLPQVAPKSSQTSSKHRFFGFQGRFSKLSGQIFGRLSLPISTFLYGLPKRAHRKKPSWKERGRRYSPQASSI